jgi:hypothetical protein
MADGRVRLRGGLGHLAEVALRKQRHDLVPQPTVTHRGNREIDVTLDGDRKTDHEHDGDRVHEVPAALKEAHDQIPQAHLTLPLNKTAN